MKNDKSILKFYTSSLWCQRKQTSINTMSKVHGKVFKDHGMSSIFL